MADYTQQIRRNYETFMRAALAEAEKAVAGGNRPFGAIIVSKKGAILSRGQDASNTARVEKTEAEAHAEIQAARNFHQARGDEGDPAYLFSTTEPCPICMQALFNMNIRTFVYGAPAQDASTRPARGAKELMKDIPYVEVVGGVLEQECLAQRERHMAGKRS